MMSVCMLASSFFYLLLGAHMCVCSAQATQQVRLCVGLCVRVCMCLQYLSILAFTAVRNWVGASQTFCLSVALCLHQLSCSCKYRSQVDKLGARVFSLSVISPWSIYQTCFSKSLLWMFLNEYERLSLIAGFGSVLLISLNSIGLCREGHWSFFKWEKTPKQN